MFHVSTLARFTLVAGFILNVPAVAQEAFLKQGTTALNPDDGRTLFLYVPGYTLLYDLGERRNIRSSRYRDRVPYRYAKTQDGIRVLIREADIQERMDVLDGYHFLVNRRMPFCYTEDACNNIWSHFSTVGDGGRVGDGGLDWQAMWRTAAKFEVLVDSENERSCVVPDVDLLKVRVSMSGFEEDGFIPRKGSIPRREFRFELELEESGFITLINCQYPVYSFTEETIEELGSPCTQERSQRTIRSLWEGIQKYQRDSRYAELNLGEILPILGLGTRTDQFEELMRGNYNEEIAEISIRYGNANEEWQVKFVEIMRRSDDSSEVYSPFGKAIVRKVRRCQAGAPTEMMFASFYFVENRESPLTIHLNKSIISGLNLPSGELNGGLVSINTQGSHHKFLDFFLGEGIPKSVANFFIKEINVTEAPQR